MIVKHLLLTVNAEDVIKEIYSQYPEEASRIHSGYYHSLFSTMRSSEELDNEDQRTIHVEYSKDFGVTNPEFIWNASYSTHKRYNHKYALKFATIAEVCSSLVDEGDLKKRSKEQYVATLLFELAHGDVMTETEGEFYALERNLAIRN